MNHPIVFSTQQYEFLQEDICRLASLQRGTLERRLFPDGERYLRVLDDVLDRDVVLVGGTTTDEATLELFDLACSLSKHGARWLTMVIPYFGYSTMERAVKPGEVVTAKTRARLLSSIPMAAYGNRALLLDLHSEGIPHYFEGGMTAFHVYGKPLVVRAAQRLTGSTSDFVLACTDAGRAKWVESLANVLGVSAAFVYKRRLDGSHTEVSAVSASVDGRDVVIYDDMIRTGGSLMGAARAYQAAGARRLFAICTHGLFPGNALERIRDSGLFQAVVCTDSHPRARELAAEVPGGFLQIETVAELFLPYLTLHGPGGDVG
jgi:ribose-phosphate pyrophosphokinase